jgi:hypothetical protein
VAGSHKTRWVALATGSFHAIAFVPFLSVLSPAVCSILVIGALIAKRSPESGKSLMWFAAGIISLFAVPIDLRLLFLSANGGTDPTVVVVALISIMLVFWCDGALAARAFKETRASKSVPQ